MIHKEINKMPLAYWGLVLPTYIENWDTGLYNLSIPHVNSLITAKNPISPDEIIETALSRYGFIADSFDWQTFLLQID
jgi:hypothetical protein